MWRNVGRFSWTRAHINAVDDRAHLANSVLLHRVYSLTKLCCKKHNEPIYGIVQKFNLIRSLAIHDRVLRKVGLSTRDVSLWRPVTHTISWRRAARRLEQRGIILPVPDLTKFPGETPVAERPQPPTWLVLYLMCYHARLPEDAHGVLALAYYHFPAAPPHLRPLLMALAAGWLARYRQFVHLDRLVKGFLDWSLRAQVQDFDFAVWLQLLAYVSSSKTTSVTVIIMLRAMQSRGVSLGEKTYDALLKSPFATPNLAMYVFSHMQSCKYQPTVQQLTRLISLIGVHWKRRWQPHLRLLHLQLVKRVRASLSPDIKAIEALYVHSEARPRLMHGSIGTWSPYLRSVTPKAERSSAAGDTRDGDDVATQEHAVAAPVHSEAEVSERTTPALVLFSDSVNTRSVIKWRSLMRIAASDKYVSSLQILRVLQRAQVDRPILSSDMTIRLSAIEGLLRRNDFANALTVWDEVRQRPSMWSKWTISVGVETLTMSGHPNQALALLEDVKSLRDPHEGSPTLIDTEAINVFMTALKRTRHLDMVFALWDYMQPLFGVTPDRHTLTSLLKTARLATRLQPSMRGALTELGLGRLLKRPAADMLPVAEQEQQAFHIMHEMLARHESSTGLWQGERAGIVALRHTRRILLSIWPELQHVEPPPVTALRPTGDFQASYPIAELFRNVMGRPVATSNADDAGARTAPSPAMSPYSQIIPSDGLFRAYIDLLATESQVPQIPLVLAWMRYLNIRASQHTLAIALVYWAEVSMDAPFMEQWKGGRSQYVKLIQWMQEWVGPWRMPTDEHIGMHIQRLKRFRELSISRPQYGRP